MEEFNVTLNLGQGLKVKRTVWANSEEEALEKARYLAHSEIENKIYNKIVPKELRK